MKKFFVLFVFTFSILLTGYSLSAQSKSGSGKSVILKPPGKFMQAPLADFNGVLMLNPDSAASIVISYPNKGESMEDLNKRLLEKVPSFFNKVKAEDTTWTSKAVQTWEGDVADSGKLFSGKSGDTLLQFVSFEREVNGLKLIYGYFAMRSAKTKESDAKKYWLDENGRGVKPFEEFAKNLAKNNP